MDNYHGWSWKGTEARGTEDNGHIDGDRMDFTPGRAGARFSRIRAMMTAQIQKRKRRSS